MQGEEASHDQRLGAGTCAFRCAAGPLQHHYRHHGYAGGRSGPRQARAQAGERERAQPWGAAPPAPPPWRGEDKGERGRACTVGAAAQHLSRARARRSSPPAPTVRAQVDEPVTAHEEKRAPGTFNVWTGRTLKEYRTPRENTGPRQASKYRCLPKADTGWTRGADSGATFACYYFARGLWCGPGTLRGGARVQRTEGSGGAWQRGTRRGRAALSALLAALPRSHHGADCNYLHRLPTEADERRHRTDYGNDIFGRERVPEARDSRKKGGQGRGMRALAVGMSRVACALLPATQPESSSARPYRAPGADSTQALARTSASAARCTCTMAVRGRCLLLKCDSCWTRTSRSGAPLRTCTSSPARPLGLSGNQRGLRVWRVWW